MTNPPREDDETDSTDDPESRAATVERIKQTVTRLKQTYHRVFR